MLRLKRLLAAMAILLLPIGAAVFAVAAPAQAAYSNCWSWCAYTDSNGNGAQWTIPASPNVCQSVPGGWNDVISSAINVGANWRVVFYSEANCWGGAITVWPGNTQNSFWPINDATSSVKIIT